MFTQMKTCTKMFIAASFIIVPTGNNTNAHGEWKNKLCHIDLMKNCPAV